MYFGSINTPMIIDGSGFRYQREIELTHGLQIPTK